MWEENTGRLRHQGSTCVRIDWSTHVVSANGPQVFFQTTSDYLGQRAQREALGQERVAHAARLRHRARLVAVHADAVGAQSQLRPRVERPDGQPRRQPQRVLRRPLCIVDDRARQRARREVAVGGVPAVGEDLGGGGQPAALRRPQQLRARLHAGG